MKDSHLPSFWRRIGLVLLSCGVVGLLTFVCFQLHISADITGLLYLVVIALISLQGRFVPALISSIVALFCLHYFFTPPLFELLPFEALDFAALFAFLTTALVVTTLVSRMRQSHRELWRREAYLAEAQRLSHTGSFSWSVSSGEIFWSEETFRIFEYDRAMKPTVESILKRVHPEDKMLVQQLIERVSREGRDFDSAYRLLMADGSIKYLQVAAHAVTDDSRNIEFVGSVMDVTKRKQAEEELRNSQQQWKDVFENNPTMYFIVNAGGTVLSVNPFGAEQLGYSVNELVGQPVLDVFYEPDRPAVQKNVADCLEHLGETMTWELRKVRKEGTVIWVRETARAVERAGGPIVLVACEDITSQKRAEEAVRNTQTQLAYVTRVAALGELTASIAHEVNQPLTAIMNNANACLALLTTETGELNEVREALSEIVSDADRASAVIARIRALVTRSPLEKTRLNLCDVVTDVLALARSEASTRGVTLQEQIPKDIPFVSGDRLQLQQVLLNLITNGMDAMNQVPEHKRLLLISGRPDVHNGHAAATIAIQDCGIRLNTEQMDRRFDSFYTTKPQGMGMGLAISRSIVEEHGGRLRAEPNSGPGTTFFFTLPAAG